MRVKSKSLASRDGNSALAAQRHSRFRFSGSAFLALLGLGLASAACNRLKSGGAFDPSMLNWEGGARKANVDVVSGDWREIIDSDGNRLIAQLDCDELIQPRVAYFKELRANHACVVGVHGVFGAGSGSGGVAIAEKDSGLTYLLLLVARESSGFVCTWGGSMPTGGRLNVLEVYRVNSAGGHVALQSTAILPEISEEWNTLELSVGVAATYVYVNGQFVLMTDQIHVSESFRAGMATMGGCGIVFQEHH